MFYNKVYLIYLTPQCHNFQIRYTRVYIGQFSLCEKNAVSFQLSERFSNRQSTVWSQLMSSKNAILQFNNSTNKKSDDIKSISFNQLGPTINHCNGPRRTFNAQQNSRLKNSVMKQQHDKSHPFKVKWNICRITYHETILEGFTSMHLINTIHH